MIKQDQRAETFVWELLPFQLELPARSGLFQLCPWAVPPRWPTVLHKQQEDSNGGWFSTSRHCSHVGLTLRCGAALHLTGPSTVTAPPPTRGQEWPHGDSPQSLQTLVSVLWGDIQSFHTETVIQGCVTSHSELT